MIFAACFLATVAISEDLDSGSGEFFNESLSVGNISNAVVKVSTNTKHACCNRETLTDSYRPTIPKQYFNTLTCKTPIQDNKRGTTVECNPGDIQKYCCELCCDDNGFPVDTDISNVFSDAIKLDALRFPDGNCPILYGGKKTSVENCKTQPKQMCCNIMKSQVYSPITQTECYGDDFFVADPFEEYCNTIITMSYKNNDASNQIACCVKPIQACGPLTTQASCEGAGCFWHTPGNGIGDFCTVKNGLYSTKKHEDNIDTPVGETKRPIRTCAADSESDTQTYQMRIMVDVTSSYTFSPSPSNINNFNHKVCPEYTSDEHFTHTQNPTSKVTTITTTTTLASKRVIGCCTNYLTIWPYYTSFASECDSNNKEFSDTVNADPHLCCTSNAHDAGNCEGVLTEAVRYVGDDKQYCCSTGSLATPITYDLKAKGTCIGTLGTSFTIETEKCVTTETLSDGTVVHKATHVEENAADEKVCCHKEFGDIYLKDHDTTCPEDYELKERQNCHPLYPHPDAKYISLVFFIGFLGSLAVNLLVGHLMHSESSQWVYGTGLGVWMFAGIVGMVQTIESLDYDNVSVMGSKLGETKGLQYLGIVSSSVNVAAGLAFIIYWAVTVVKSEKNLIIVSSYFKIPLFICLILQAGVAFTWAACTEGQVTKAQATVLEIHVIAVGILIALVASTCCPVSSTTWQSLKDQRFKFTENMVNVIVRMAAVALATIGLFMMLAGMRHKESEDKWVYDATLAAPIVMLSSLLFYIIYLIMVNATVCAVSSEKTLKILSVFANVFCVSGFILLVVVFARLGQTLERNDWHSTNAKSEKIHQETIVAVVGAVLFAVPTFPLSDFLVYNKNSNENLYESGSTTTYL